MQISSIINTSQRPLGHSTVWVIIICALSQILLNSCKSQKKVDLNENPFDSNVHVGIVQDEDLTMELAYIGAIGHSYVYECSITNHLDLPTVIDKSQFHLEINGTKVVGPINEEEVVSELKKTSSSLKKKRNQETVLGIFGLGLNTVLTGASGASPIAALIANGEPLIYILDDRRWYKKNINSVEDEIAYVRTAQFNLDLIPAHSTVVKDLLFPVIPVDGDVEVTLYKNDHNYTVTFPKDIFR